MSNTTVTNIGRGITHKITDIRNYLDTQVADTLRSARNKTILEIGSGKPVKGKYSYSTKHLIHESNTFLPTDIDPSFGHPILDITTMKDENKYDVIICMNVLEHVYDTKSALANMHRSLRKGGTLLIGVPMNYPLHDEPHDYWRFTEHVLRRLLEDAGYTITTFKHKGMRKYPFAYYIEAKKH